MKLLATLSAGLLFLILGFATIAHSQEPKSDEAKPEEAHPGAQAPRPQAAPPRPEVHPQAEPAHPPAPHEARPPEVRPQPEHPAEAHPQPERPPEVRPQTEHEHRAPTPQPEAHPPEPQNRTAAPLPPTSARPERTARPAAEPPRTAEQRGPAPTLAQQRDWDRHRVENWQAEHHNWQQRGGYHGYRVPGDRYRVYFGSPHVFRIYEYPVTFVSGYPRFQYGGYWVQVVDPWPGYWASNWFYTDPVYVEYLNDGYYLIDTRYPGVPLAVEIFG